jgi:CheY-like chemotaxis protein
LQDAKNIRSCLLSNGVRLAALPLRLASATIRYMSRTVLIVDDHPSFRASARAMLESAGFVVIGEAEDGASALTAVDELTPDVVVLDIQLPDMTGFDVCAALERRNGATPDIILVSSRDITDYGELVASSCACGFVPKGELSGDLVSELLP